VFRGFRRRNKPEPRQKDGAVLPDTLSGASETRVATEGRKMEWRFVFALVIAVPVILLPAACIWLLNIGGLFAAYRVAREKRTEVKRVAAPK
jgi:hypothetical protein